ncbi:MAG: hypothetical protein EOO04_05730 [Chitinophagaceae bacterium]|nr:MAG: hypothetical protein EOO04_05730 [Chitinophagaceae bacterium]
MKFSTGSFLTGNMVNNIGNILTQLFHRDSLESISEQELRYFIRQYPYFGPGHLLLAKKLQLAGEKRAFEREVSVTSSYFTNPAWLQYILKEVEMPGVQIAEPDKLDTPGLPLVHPADIEKEAGGDDNPVLTESAVTEQEKIAEKALEHSSELTHDEVEEIKAADADPVNDASLNFTDEAGNENKTIAEPLASTVNDTEEETGSRSQQFTEEIADPELSGPDDTSTRSHQFVVAENHAFAAEAASAAGETAIQSNQFIIAGADMVAPDTENTGTTPHDNAENSSTDTPGAPDKDPAAIEAEADPVMEASAGVNKMPQDAAGNSETTLETAPQAETNSPAMPADNFSRALRGNSSAGVTQNESLAFDPYHTIDYFASQGIKLRLEDFNKDKLGQQLKSFTEWIRSMKRLPARDPEDTIAETEQHSIRKIAEHSVEGKDVLTESMAEVWVKQGNYEKARQIYHKLSLQNPSKSTYFAAKIDQLNAL